MTGELERAINELPERQRDMLNLIVKGYIVTASAIGIVFGALLTVLIVALT